MNELKYCKFCDKEKPVKYFCKSGLAIKNICKECQNKKQTQIYKNSKEVDKLQQENKKLNGTIQTYDILLKANVEENKQLKEKLDCDLQWAFKYEKQVDNWNKLKKYIKETKLKEFEKSCGKRYGKTFTQAEIIICNMILDKMQELKGSDSNEYRNKFYEF